MTEVPWKVIRFSNEVDRPMELVVEPWATQLTIEPRSRFAVLYQPPDDRADESFSELRGDMVVFWCEGPTFEVEIDGAIVPT